MSGVRSIWGLRLLALLVAIFLWFTISSPQREGVSQTILDVTVSYAVPQSLVVLDPVEQVRVRLRGPTSRVLDIDAGDVEAYVDLSGVEAGPVEVKLSPENNFRLPDDIEISSIEPPLLHLSLDQEVILHVPVNPVFTEEAQSKLHGREVTVSPSTVLARGPESRLSPETDLETAPIPIEGEVGNFTTRVPVVPTEPLIQVLRPRTVTVSVHGPAPERVPEQAPEQTSATSEEGNAVAREKKDGGA